MRRVLHSELVLVLALTALAFAVRLYHLPQIPPGLYYDEAANGLDAQQVLAGDLSIFFERNYGREPLFIYLQAATIALFGATPFALRLTSTVIGALTIPAVYWMVREAFHVADSRSRWLATWTALFVSVSYWHLSFSRIGFRAILVPLTACLAFVWFWRAWHRLDSGLRFPWSDLILSGIFVGISLYTYTAGRFVPVLVVIVMATGAITGSHSRPRLGRIGTGLLVIGGSALIVFAPLGYYFVAHPGTFVGRASSVSILNAEYNGGSPLQALANSAVKTAGMFGLAGDQQLRHNPAGLPAIDPIPGLWLLAGIALVVARRRSLPHVFALAWFAILSLPAVLTASALPHALRTLGMLPAAYLLPVLAMAAVGDRLGGRLRYLAAWLPLPFLLFSGITSIHSYFAAWDNNPNLAWDFHVPFADTAQTMTEYGKPDGVWLIPRSMVSSEREKSSSLTIDFLYRGEAGYGMVVPDEVEGPKELRQLTTGRGQAYLVRWNDPTRLPEGAYMYADPKGLVDFLLNKVAQPVDETRLDIINYTTYDLPKEAYYSVATSFAPQDVSFAGKVRLVGSAYGHTATSLQEPPEALDEKRVASGESAWVALHWQAETPIDYDLKTTVYLADNQGHVVGQVDNLLVGNTYPFNRTWEQEETAGTYHILDTLPGTPPGRYTLYLGVYEANSMRRYPEIGPDGRSGPVAVPLGTLDITPPITTPSFEPAHPLSQPLALAPDMVLLGYDLPTPSAKPGDRLPLTLYWKAIAHPSANYDVVVELYDNSGQAVWSRGGQPAGEDYPTGRWPAGEALRGWQDLDIPDTLPEGEYSLWVTLYNGGEAVGQQDLDTITIRGRPRQFKRPAIDNPMDYALSDDIVFLGYDLGRSRARPGGAIELTVYWKAIGPTDASYTVFTHLLDGNGQVQGAEDDIPGQGELPTTGWMPGEYITDSYELEIQPDAPEGSYQIELGMYDAATGIRLSVTDDSKAQGDRILLPTPITVTP